MDKDDLTEDEFHDLAWILKCSTLPMDERYKRKLWEKLDRNYSRLFRQRMATQRSAKD